MGQFSSVNNTKYPKKPSEPRADDSAGFMQPYKLGSGNTRGTQIVGFGGTKIDGANNRITIKNDDGSSVGMGSIPNTTDEFGFFSLDSNDNLIMKLVNGTKYVYNPSDDYKNVTQDGLLPDDSGGFIVAKEGTEVGDAFTE